MKILKLFPMINFLKIRCAAKIKENINMILRNKTFIFKIKHLIKIIKVWLI